MAVWSGDERLGMRVRKSDGGGEEREECEA